MEDTHREPKGFDGVAVGRLNPCSNGRYSQRVKTWYPYK